jgi:hypothetical protein
MAKTKTCRPPRNISVPKAISKPPSQADLDLNRAVERIYQTYGPDLSAFFNVVQTELRRERYEREQSARL